MKSIPTFDLNNARPPYDQWNYFEGSKEHPFIFEATSLEMVNAWWLIEASTLAYSKPELIETVFAGQRFTNFKFFSGPSTQCYVVSNDRFAIVAFRGTEIRRRPDSPNFANVVKDILADAMIELVPWEKGGRVHKGFKEALDEVWDDQQGSCSGGLSSHLKSIAGARNGFRVWFTGHSLGAALATLAASRYADPQGLYTFGSPRVGDLEFRKNFSVNAYRFVNNTDIVCMIPPRYPYEHVGTEEFIDSNHIIQENPENEGVLKSVLLGHVLDILCKMKLLKTGVLNILPKGLLDHVPILYSVQIWNIMKGIDSGVQGIAPLPH